jgi:prepilin-type N-terminal cleavage/methylation domain-containing protein/prepilin-type processing-associated H-X9-DG protein
MHEVTQPMPHFRHQAFTLVELLVVLAIMSVLAGMLLGAVNTVRDSSKSAGCKNNLRQIGLGVVGYALQSEDYLPAASISGGLVNKYDSNCVPGFLITTMDLPYPVLTTTPSAPVKSVFICPASGSTEMLAADPNWGLTSYANSDVANGYYVQQYWYGPAGAYRYLTQSYSVNAIVNNYPSWYPLEDFVTNSGGTLKGKPLSKISQPVSTIMIFDGGIIFHNGRVARIAARHRNRTLTNLVFFDGHVAAYPTFTDLQSIYLLQTATGEKRFSLGAGYTGMY